MKSTIAEPTTQTLDVPGATLAYDVRRNDDSTEPPLFLIGSPMGAAGFGTLSSHFTDRTVATYDPRGTERSTLDEPTKPPTPEDHADDLHRIIQELGGGPVDLFASSGGAVNALALVATYPDDVRTLVAHEPPLPSVLPDREAAIASAQACHETLHAARLGRRHGALHRRRQPRGRVPGRLRAAARPRSGDVRHANGGRRLADRSSARAGIGRFDRVRARPRCPAGGLDAHRHGRRQRGGHDGQPRRVRRRRAAGHRRWWRSRAVTAASSAASTASRASPTPSPRSSETS